MTDKSINYLKHYCLESDYLQIKNGISKYLKEYVGETIFFEDNLKTLSFYTETLIPEIQNDRPNILLLFANPHPGSIKTGMFLCTTESNPHHFWNFMQDSGWFKLLTVKLSAQYLRKTFLAANYDGPFNLFFDCFYDFPSDDPKELYKIFSRDYFETTLQGEARKNLAELVSKHNIDAILSFNSKVTEIITGTDMNGFTDILSDGDLIRHTYVGDKNHPSNIPLYQTYPAGYRFIKEITEKRKNNLTKIKEDICMQSEADNNHPEDADITEPSMIFKIGELYRPNFSPIELYDYTRGRWIVGKRCKKAELAFAVYQGKIIEVYEILKWFPAGKTFSTRTDPVPPRRSEFIGNIAKPEIRNKYRYKSVAKYFGKGARNPVRYINIKP